LSEFQSGGSLTRCSANSCGQTGDHRKVLQPRPPGGDHQNEREGNPDQNMNKRFEIPVEPAGFNTFAIDDYLRMIQTPEKRKEIIATVGYSPQLREAYEKTHGLPRGAVELAMLTEDTRFKQSNEKIVKRFTGKDPGSLDQKEIQQALMEVQSM